LYLELLIFHSVVFLQEDYGFPGTFFFDTAVSNFFNEFLHDQSCIRSARMYVNKYT